jgi:hypothetical protein
MLIKINGGEKLVTNQLFTNFDVIKIIMETITIEFQPNVKDNVIAFLNSFSKNDLQIIEKNSPKKEDSAFIANRDRLHLAVKKFESGKSKAKSLEELDAYLENISSEYSN